MNISKLKLCQTKAKSMNIEEPDNRIPQELQPSVANVEYDLDEELSSVVSLRANIPEDAFTASILGTERAGHGVLIRGSGLIVTIGYIVTEADSIWIVTNKGQAVPGHLVGYDYESGFGLVQSLGNLDIPHIPIGNSKIIEVGSPLVLAGYGGVTESVSASCAARKEFAGYWEYVIDNAIFTSPPHPNWGGAALIGGDGSLCGIGSLYIDQIGSSSLNEGNLCVPIELLEPVLDELVSYGRTLKPARPWLGMFVSEFEERFMVAGVYNNAPAAIAGLQAGDVVTEINGQKASNLSNLFKTVWSVGPAGSAIPVRVERDGSPLEITVDSVDRRDLWKLPNLH